MKYENEMTLWAALNHSVRAAYIMAVTQTKNYIGSNETVVREAMALAWASEKVTLQEGQITNYVGPRIRRKLGY